MNSQYCPVCASRCVPAYGNPKSKILIIGEFPGDAEIEQGRPFVGKSGGVFRSELARLGIDLNNLRLMNLWLHAPNKDERCWQLGYDMVLEEAKRRKSILLVGSEAVSTFTEYSVSKVCGLNVDSLFSCKNVYAVVNPAIVFHAGGVGELRLGLKKWTDFLKEEKLV